MIWCHSYDRFNAAMQIFESAWDQFNHNLLVSSQFITLCNIKCSCGVIFVFRFSQINAPFLVCKVVCKDTLITRLIQFLCRQIRGQMCRHKNTILAEHPMHKMVSGVCSMLRGAGSLRGEVVIANYVPYTYHRWVGCVDRQCVLIF